MKLGRRGKAMAIVAAALALLVVIHSTYVVETEKAQFRDNAAGVIYEVADTSNVTTLVVCFTRSRNTHLMAKEIAVRYNAELVILKAEDYRIGLVGWLSAQWDAGNKYATIEPETIDLSQFDTVFVGSPIWWYSPAPPIWQFVASNDFTGKDVILFNTFNSRFKQGKIDAFKGVIEAQNGRFAGHIYVKRNRMPNQIGTDSLLQAVRVQLDSLQVRREP